MRERKAVSTSNRCSASSAWEFCSAVLLMLTASGFAQAQDFRLSPQVQPFVRVEGPLTALIHARVIDGSGGTALEDQTLILRDGRIAALGDSGQVEVPSDAETLDLSGKSVIPGLVMLHEHFFYPAGNRAYNQQEFSFPRLYLAGGATTIRTGGSRDPYGDLNLKRQIDSGRIPGPKVHVTGPYLNGPGLPILFVNHLRDADHARRMVDYWSQEGATSFKAYMHITRDELRAAIEQAHLRGHKVTGHLCSVTYREAADMGIDNLEHGIFASTDFVPDKRLDQCPGGAARTESLISLDIQGAEAQGLIRHLVERGVALTSTLTVFEASVPGRPAAPEGALESMSPDARDRYLRTWTRIAQRNDQRQVDWLQKGMDFEHAFAQAGGLLVVGTDPTGNGGVVPGYANQRAIELLVEAGFSAEEAIRAATFNGAVHLGIEDHVGTIAKGKAADLVVLDGDPSRNIQDIRRMEIVFKDGIGYDSQKLFDSVRGTVGIR